MSIVREAIKQELVDLIPKSQEYAEQIKTAKTDTKKRMLRKKLVKNNQKIADLMIALDRLPEEENDDDKT